MNASSLTDPLPYFMIVSPDWIVPQFRPNSTAVPEAKSKCSHLGQLQPILTWRFIEDKPTANECMMWPVACHQWIVSLFLVLFMISRTWLIAFGSASVTTFSNISSCALTEVRWPRKLDTNKKWGGEWSRLWTDCSTPCSYDLMVRNSMWTSSVNVSHVGRFWKCDKFSVNWFVLIRSWGSLETFPTKALV